MMDYLTEMLTEIDSERMMTRLVSIAQRCANLATETLGAVVRKQIDRLFLSVQYFLVRPAVKPPFVSAISETIEEVQQIATQWLWTYNHERPNLGIGDITPTMKLEMAA